MGQASSPLRALASPNPTRILMVGLDAAGKTTVLYKMFREVETTIPTIGFNMETASAKGTTLICWDVGGRDKIRPLYRHYYSGINAVVWVVDSHDVDRLEDAREELEKVVHECELSGLPILVLANKQDLPNAMKPEEVAARLQLWDQLGCGRTWHVAGTCATSSDGLEMAFAWLSAAIKSNMPRPPRPPLVNRPGRYFVTARGLPIHERRSSGSRKFGEILRGECVEVLEIACTEIVGLMWGRVEQPHAGWVQLHANYVQLPMIVLTLCTPVDSSDASAVSCVNMAGVDLASFSAEEAARTAISELRERFAKQLDTSPELIRLTTQAPDARVLGDADDARTLAAALAGEAAPATEAATESKCVVS
eukprot:NODE_10587_length_1341_cov_15.627677.p1 GENE.NODE_10587_length_1341_cov_15.627677~~NODE_10587_length_1341_cov_15.627677.p1  ORF type:complete len:365 (+),score=85.42 NODE_10587_length_1341_cov_15.627677:129-1223(+)